MKKLLEVIAKFAIYVSFFVPLVVVPGSFIFPFIVPKILLFRVLVEIALAAYVMLLFINWEYYKPRSSPVFLGLFLFILSFGLSTFSGVDWYHSFWDNHERMLGLFTILHYFIYYVICTAVFKNWKDWKTVLRIFLTAGFLVMLVAVIQVKDPTFLLNQGGNRVASTLGNSIYVSGYGLFLFFTALLLFAREDKKNYGWLAFYAAAGLSGFGGVFFGGSRGAMLGLLVGILAVLFFYAVSVKGNKRLKTIFYSLLILFFVFLGVAYLNRQSVFVKNIPAVGRLMNTSLWEITGGPRVIAWQIAVKGWQERPVFGWGPNNFFYAFNKHYNPRSLEFGYSETWFDNAHNIILNTLAVQGAFGIFTYLSIFILAAWSLVICFKKEGLNIHMMVLGVSFLLAHLVQNTTVFENPTSYLYFVVWLAMISSITYKEKAVSAKSISVDKKISYGLLSFPAVALFIFIFIFNIQPARANIKTLDTMKRLGGGNLSEIPTILQDTLSFNSPHIDDIRSDLGKAVFDLITSNKSVDKTLAEKLLLVVYAELQKNIVLHPLDIRNYLILAQLGQYGYVLTEESSYLLGAHNFVAKGLEYSPRRQQLIYALAVLKFQFNQKIEAIALLERALADNYKIGESYWRMAYFYQLDGQNEKAKEVIALAEKNGVAPDSMGKEVINFVLADTTDKQP